MVLGGCSNVFFIIYLSALPQLQQLYDYSVHIEPCLIVSSLSLALASPLFRGMSSNISFSLFFWNIQETGFHFKLFQIL